MFSGLAYAPFAVCPPFASIKLWFQCSGARHDFGGTWGQTLDSAIPTRFGETQGQTLDSAILDLSSGGGGCALGFSRPKS